MKLNGKHLNGHGGKSAAGNMIAVKSGMVAKPKDRLGRTRQAGDSGLPEDEFGLPAATSLRGAATKQSRSTV